MNAVAWIMFILGVVFCPVSLTLTAWQFFKLPEHLRAEAVSPPRVVMGWILGLACIVAAIVIW